MEEYFRGLNFYQVIICGPYTTSIMIGTYRPKDTVKDLFATSKEYKGAAVNIWEVSLKLIKTSKEWFPIFCVELHTEYSDLEELAKDLMIWRVSGMMEKEMEGML